MNKTLKKTLILSLASYLGCATILSGCTKSGGDQFIGTWASAKASDGTLTVEKNGEIYFIYHQDHKPFEYCPSGATYDQGKLSCGNGLSFGYDSKNDNVLLGIGITSTVLHRVK
jgi:hypothetical protein